MGLSDRPCEKTSPSPPPVWEDDRRVSPSLSPEEGAASRGAADDNWPPWCFRSSLFYHFTVASRTLLYSKI